MDGKDDPLRAYLVTMPSEVVYEIPKAKPHHHLLCRTCGREQEIGQEAMAGMFALVEERHGFKAETDHLVLHGVYAACRATASKKVATPRASGAHPPVGDN